MSPSFVDYINNRQVGEEGPEGDLGPESIVYIHSSDSPTGEALMVVANEVSGTTTVYSFGVASEAPAASPTPAPTDEQEEGNFFLGVIGVALLVIIAALAVVNVFIGIVF